MNSTKNIIITITITAGITWLVFNSISSKNTNSPQANVMNSTQSSGQSTDGHHAGSSLVNYTVFKNLVGKKAPEFSLTSYDGKSYSLESLKGKNVVLFFSEGLMCYPACWNQIAAFGKDNRFSEGDTVALTIVNDRKEDWKSAIDKMPDLSFATVLSDTDRVVSVAYGVLNLPSSMHRGQLPGHSYVVIDKQGIVRYVFDDSAMGLQNDMMVSELGKIN